LENIEAEGIFFQAILLARPNQLISQA